MLGAIIGDIVGSPYEFRNLRSKDFPLFIPPCHPTDDSILTVAICKALLASADDYSDLEANADLYLHQIGRSSPFGGFGPAFYRWLYLANPHPYNSLGNGAGMRVSGCAYWARSLAEAKDLSNKVTGVTHNHPEGLKGGEAITVATYMALHKASMAEIRAVMTAYYPDQLEDPDFTLDNIRPTYKFDMTCQGSIPQALEAFFEATSFEDALRNAVSIGGDSDTIAAMTGAIAGAFWEIPPNISTKAREFIPIQYLNIIDEFELRCAERAQNNCDSK